MHEPPSVSPWRVQVQPDDFDAGQELAGLRAACGGAGAVACFVGIVREWQQTADERGGHPAAGRPLVALELEHYPGMTQRSLQDLLDHAAGRFGLLGGTIVHRVGRLLPSEQIVLVATASAHRHAAFDGCAFLMDALKTQAPFWKKAHFGDHAEWVEARSADDEALRRWGSRGDNTGGVGSEAGDEPGAPEGRT